MQACLYAIFWFSLALLIFGSLMMERGTDLLWIVAFLASFGFLIKSWVYRGLSLIIVGLALALAYHQYEWEKMVQKKAHPPRRAAVQNAKP